MSEQTITFLLSAEESANLADEPWIRDATEVEIAAVEEVNPGMVFDELKIDETGRPYFWTTIMADHPELPARIRDKARTTLRVWRF